MESSQDGMMVWTKDSLMVHVTVVKMDVNWVVMTAYMKAVV